MKETITWKKVLFQFFCRSNYFQSIEAQLADSFSKRISLFENIGHSIEGFQTAFFAAQGTTRCIGHKVFFVCS